ncbi:hypothetical protein GCM10009716_00040 [Streptomyces sodiiphilus]|uniref:Uncharacterized protein n=1 Tax=Streptomyces sodiiphilus TaxID=226217 RepID=A0ABN2NQ11_9ACTN
MITLLAERELVVSAAQLERWRRAGLLPRHRRRWLGRGQGSAAVLEAMTVEIAASLARHARQGRDLRWTVLGWYTEAGRPPLPGHAAVPAPPWTAVREALLWAMAASPAHRLLVQARAARGEAAQDAVYTAADRLLAHAPGDGPHPNRVRQMLLAGGEEPCWRGPGRRPVAQLAVAAGMGADELAASLLTGSLAATGMLAPGGGQALSERLEQAEKDGTLLPWLAQLVDGYDPLAALAAATEQEMARAREAALTLAGFGGLYVMHGLLMPDTPALAALRDAIDQAGGGPLLRNALAAMTHPQYVATMLSSCLTPAVAAFGDYLGQALAGHPQGLFYRPEQPHDRDQYMNEWIAAMRAATYHGA